MSDFRPSIYLTHHDRIVVIKTSTHAVEQLLNGWPDRGSAEWYHALNACRLARGGLFDIDKARKAFMRAAKQAKLL